jgi:hypothetical protein
VKQPIAVAVAVVPLVGAEIVNVGSAVTGTPGFVQSSAVTIPAEPEITAVAVAAVTTFVSRGFCTIEIVGAET